MGLPNRVLLNTDGKIVVGESDHPQVTNDTGGSCCCGCPVPYPNNYSDDFSGYEQSGNLYVTDEAVRPYPFIWPNEREPYFNHQPAMPYTPEQLEYDNAKYQLIVLKDGQGKNGGKTNTLMWDGRVQIRHPWWYKRNWESGDARSKIKQSIVDAAYSNYSPNDSTKSWRTSTTIVYGEGCPNHSLAYNYETEQDEKPTMGFPTMMGLYTAAPLHRYSAIGKGIHYRPAANRGFSIEVSDFAQINPNPNPDFVQGEDEPFFLFPYIYETEEHLKKVTIQWHTLGDPLVYGGNTTERQTRQFLLPIQSGDELAIEVNVIDHKVIEAPVSIGQYFFCVRFLINGFAIATEKASVQSKLGSGSEQAATLNPAHEYYCSFGHGIVYDCLGRRTHPDLWRYYEKWNEWADANYPRYNTRSGYLSPRLTAYAFSWMQNNDYDTFPLPIPETTVWFDDYTPRVGGFDTYNHTMSSSPLDFDCGVVNEPDVVVMQNFADATGRSLDPPAGDTPTPPPVSFSLTYPYNWANISTITPTNFPAVLSGDTPTSPLTYTIASGGLPPSGLYLNATTGLVAGTPVSNGSGTVSIQVTDADGNTATSPVYTWNVTGAGGGGGGGGGGAGGTGGGGTGGGI